MGSVNIPTISKVVINIARTGYDTPLLISTLQRGNAINPGISEMEPVIPAIKYPITPEPSPIQFMSFSFGIINRNILTKISTLIRVGRSFKNIFAPLLIPCKVFCLLTKNETIIAIDAKTISSVKI